MRLIRRIRTLTSPGQDAPRNNKQVIAIGELLDERLLRRQQDLDLNVPGLELCLELLEERDRLYARMRVLERRC